MRKPRMHAERLNVQTRAKARQANAVTRHGSGALIEAVDDKVRQMAEGATDRQPGRAFVRQGRRPGRGGAADCRSDVQTWSSSI